MQELLCDWNPGFGEIETIRRMRPAVQEFIRDAVREEPSFLTDYLLPTLEGLDPEEKIVSDLSSAIAEVEIEDAFRGGVDVELRGLGNFGFLGKSLKSKLKKVVKKVVEPAKKVHEKVEAVVEKALPKPLQKIHEKAKETVERTHEKVKEKVHEVAKDVGRKVQEGAKKVWVKYGNTIIGVAGAVLAPFTGGASLAAAAALTAANGAYQKKRAADAARRDARHDAAQLTAQANTEQTQAEQQLNEFYSQNQSWFLQYDITPDKWASYSFDEKVELINAGSAGRLPRTPSRQPETPASYAPPTGGASSGGGMVPSGGGGGGPYSEGTSSSGFAPYGSSPGRPVVSAGMFDGSMLPVLAVGAALALLFGKSTGGGRRTKRNPRGRQRRVA